MCNVLCHEINDYMYNKKVICTKDEDLLIMRKYLVRHTDFIGEISSGNLKIGKIPILTKESCQIEA